MSRVTNVILTAHVGPLDGTDPEIDSVNRFLQEKEGGGFWQFVEVSEKAGGMKHMECRVYPSAFNHGDTEVILRAVDQAPWRDRESVQVFVMEQGKRFFGFGIAAGRNLDDAL